MQVEPTSADQWLSYRASAVSKSLILLVPAAAFLLIVVVAAREGRADIWTGVAIVSLVLLVLVNQARRVKQVRIEGDSFIVSELFGEPHRVPIRHFVRYDRDPLSRWPSFWLYFDPPTPFGRGIRLDPPLSWPPGARTEKRLRALLTEHKSPLA